MHNGLTVNHIVMKDAQSINFGDNTELMIWHDAGGDSMIRNSVATGKSLKIRSESIKFRNFGDGKSYLEGTVDQDVSLFHNNQKRLATSGVGVTVYSGSSTEAKVDIKPGTGSFTGTVLSLIHISEPTRPY